MDVGVSEDNTDASVALSGRGLMATDDVSGTAAQLATDHVIPGAGA